MRTTIFAIAASIAVVGIAAYTQMDAAPLPKLPITGTARTIDGDTNDAGGRRVRLWGIDAAERGTAAGDRATAALRHALDGRPVTCTDTGERSHGRVVGVCRDGEGRDIAGAMVAAGLARDCYRYSGGFYLRHETAANSHLPQATYCNGKPRP